MSRKFVKVVSLFFISIFFLSCNSYDPYLSKILDDLKEKGHFINIEITRNNENSISFKFMDTIQDAEFPEIFDMYNEYITVEIREYFKNISNLQFYYYRIDLHKYVSFNFDKEQIDRICKRTSSRHEVISKILNTLSYQEISEIEYAYYQFQRYSPEYKSIDIHASELIILKASECYLEPDENHNLEFLLAMFKDVEKKDFSNFIQELINQYCDE